MKRTTAFTVMITIILLAGIIILLHTAVALAEIAEAQNNAMLSIKDISARFWIRTGLTIGFAIVLVIITKLMARRLYGKASSIEPFRTLLEKQAPHH